MFDDVKQVTSVSVTNMQNTRKSGTGNAFSQGDIQHFPNVQSTRQQWGGKTPFKDKKHLQ